MIHKFEFGFSSTKREMDPLMWLLNMKPSSVKREREREKQVGPKQGPKR